MKKLLKGFPPYMEKSIRQNSPLFLGIHLKPVCNFRCKKCFIGEQKELKNLEPTLSLQEIFKIMTRAKKIGMKVFGLTGAGEPLLDNRAKKIIKKANKLGFITHIPTNASILNEETIKFLRKNNVTLILSLDALDKKLFVDLTQTHPRIHKKVIENVKLAQEIYKGTKIKKNGWEVYRIAIHMTLHGKNMDQVEKIKKIVMQDTLFSLSPMAYTGFATCNFNTKDVKKLRDIQKGHLNEKHIVITKDKALKKDVCGFFKFGVDINFDGQLLLDAHAIETRNVLENIRSFNFNLQEAFDYLTIIKDDFIKENYMSGFCPVRSPRLEEWIKERQEMLILEKQFRKQIIKDIKQKNPLLKYAYLGNGAISFINVLKSPEYYTYKNEVNLINKYAHKIKNKFEDNVIVLGVGNGEKLGNILNDLDNNHVVLVDISKKLLETSLNVLNRNFNVENISFEKLKLNKFPKKISFILLGGTLANMKNWDTFLLKLKKRFPKQNIFLGLEFIDENKPSVIKKIIKEYDNESGFKFIFLPLSILGFSRQDGNIEVKFNYKKNRIEEFFILNSSGKKKARMLKLPSFKKILLSISIKLEKDKFINKIKKLGFEKGLEFKHENNSIIELKF